MLGMSIAMALLVGTFKKLKLMADRTCVRQGPAGQRQEP